MGLRPLLISSERLLFFGRFSSRREGVAGIEKLASCGDLSEGGGACSLAGISISEAIKVSEQGEEAEKRR